MSTETITLDGRSLTLEQLESLARGAARAELDPAARRRMEAARHTVERAAAGDAPVYGVNTGFGHLATVRVDPARLDELQINLVRSHCAGVGPPLPAEQVRAAMALRANALARGHSGIRPETVETLLALLNAGAVPVVPSQGSVGASGDLAPLAQIALALTGEGTLVRDGRPLPALVVLRDLGLEPVRLAAKEGLALINGTQVSTGLGALALLQAERLACLADIAGASSLEGLKGSVKAFDARIQEIRPHPGQATVAGHLRRLTADSSVGESHRECGRVQDSYALRCMPQVHGAVRDALAHVRSVLEIETNATTDNPVVFSDTGEMISCGNFHGAPVAYGLDFLAIVMTDLASISERRIDRLVNPVLSDLPPFLSRDAGLHSGFMLAQVTAAALVSENKTLAHPASIDSIPTSANKEDHVSMSTWAARKATQVVDNVRRVVAIELLVAAQALDLLAPLVPGAGVAAVHAAIRERVPVLEADRVLSADIERLETMLLDGSLRAAAEAAVGPLE